MIEILDQTKEMIDPALANGCPCILATVSGDGEPDIGYKGSMMVFDKQSLAYLEGEPESRRAVPRCQNQSGLALSRHGDVT